MNKIEAITSLSDSLTPDIIHWSPGKCKSSIAGKCNKKLGNCNGYKHCRKKVIGGREA